MVSVVDVPELLGWYLDVLTDQCKENKKKLYYTYPVIKLAGFSNSAATTTTKTRLTTTTNNIIVIIAIICIT